MRKLNVEEMGRIDVETFRRSTKLPLVMVLDNVRSLHNVGSVFRTADAFRLEGLYLCGITATPPSAEIHKTALGAEDSVAWHYVEDTAEAVRSLQKEGYIVLAVEQVEGSYKLDTFEFDTNQRYALVMGNEVKGVRQDVVDLCDGALEIPQFGCQTFSTWELDIGINLSLRKRYLRLASPLPLACIDRRWLTLTPYLIHTYNPITTTHHGIQNKHCSPPATLDGQCARTNVFELCILLGCRYRYSRCAL